MASSQLALRVVQCAASGEDPVALAAARLRALGPASAALPNGLGLFSETAILGPANINMFYNINSAFRYRLVGARE